jgi:hypothetical protein
MAHAFVVVVGEVYLLAQFRAIVTMGCCISWFNNTAYPSEFFRPNWSRSYPSNSQAIASASTQYGSYH